MPPAAPTHLLQPGKLTCGIRELARRTTCGGRAAVRAGRLRDGTASADCSAALARGRPIAWRDRMGGRVGRAEVRSVASRCADRRATARDAQARLSRAGSPQAITPFAPHAATTTIAPVYWTPVNRRGEPERDGTRRGLNRSPCRIETHRRHVAGCRRCFTEDRFGPNGPRHAATAARRRANHTGPLHARPPGGH